MSEFILTMLLGVVVGIIYTVFARLRQRASSRNKNSDFYWAVLLLVIFIFVLTTWFIFQESAVLGLTFAVSGLISAFISAGITFKGKPVGLDK